MFYVDPVSGLYSNENLYGENGVEIDADIFTAGSYSVTDSGEVVASAEYTGAPTRGLIRYEP